ncbi:MAG: hypothetical protein M3552_20980 [Planctomycetota bacterium]|nr:hypothetical protein [Planctomycetaceae bacterium]MDQ3333090.1 hypothetical protein [Planctomycetota bacterium]
MILIVDDQKDIGTGLAQHLTQLRLERLIPSGKIRLAEFLAKFQVRFAGGPHE